MNEDDHIRVLTRRFGRRARTEAVEPTPRHLAGRPMSRDEALAMHGSEPTFAVPVDESLRA